LGEGGKKTEGIMWTDVLKRNGYYAVLRGLKERVGREHAPCLFPVLFHLLNMGWGR